MGNLTPGEADTVRSLLRILAYTGTAGAAAGLGAGVLRNANPRYESPDVPTPVIVDMPVPTRTPVVGPVPVPRKTTATSPVRAALPPAKAAGVIDDVSERVKALGGWVHDQLPTFHHPLGPTGAATARDVPARWGLAIPIGAAGLAGGYAIGDRVARAAERRRAQAELDAARKEYQDVVTARTAHLYFPKAAAGVTALLTGVTPTDPHLARAKAALDAAWTKIAADPDPADVGRGSSQAAKTLMSWLWPGFLHKDLAPVQAGVIGGLGTIGALGAYRRFRDESKADQVRRETEARDLANAARIPAPVIARLVPVPAG